MSFHAAENHPIKYLAVYNDLKEAILSGKYLRGSFLPTEVELTELYSVSRTTVRKAVSLLQSEKLVNVQQGRGTEVISGKSQVRLTMTDEDDAVAAQAAALLADTPDEAAVQTTGAEQEGTGDESDL